MKEIDFLELVKKCEEKMRGKTRNDQPKYWSTRNKMITDYIENQNETIVLSNSNKSNKKTILYSSLKILEKEGKVILK